MKTLQLSLAVLAGTISILCASYHIGSATAEPISILDSGIPPIIMTQVELWEPSSFHIDGIMSCEDNETSLGPWAVGWVELHNTKNDSITISDVDLKGKGWEEGQFPITLGPQEYCYIVTQNQLSTRIGVGGSLGNGPPPHDNATTMLSYSIQSFDKKMSYTYSTPPLSDDLGDAKTWQLVDGNWVFLDANFKQELFTKTIMSPLQQFKSGIASNDVKCEQDLQLVIKAEDNSPACVKPQTAQKLVEHGWGWAMQPIDSLKPLLPNRIVGLENDTGIVTFGNRTYYFETPNYTQDAYVNPVHISFHGIVFTLFPPGFKGGLPTDFGGVAANGCSGSYFWTDAKFPDGTHKLLSIFAMTTMSQQCLSLPAPTYFSTHTDPLAGLTFYDGKLKLLVSVEGMLQQNNTVFSPSIQTNETIYHDFPQPRGYSIINSTQGIIVNDDAEASNLTGFSVKSPTDLPQGYKVKLIKASKEIPLVTIFVSKYPLTANATSEDFLWNQQGILITYDKTNPFELEHFKQLFPENEIITINGTPAVISDISKQYHNGYPYDMWGNLVAIQNNDTNIGIRGFFNSDELIKIATSMLEK